MQFLNVAEKINIIEIWLPLEYTEMQRIHTNTNII